MGKYLNIFFESFGTRDNFNMVGINKIHFINKNLKIFDFEYLGNSKKDLPIWDYCKKIIYTNASPSLQKILNTKDLDKFEIEAKFK